VEEIYDTVSDTLQTTFGMAKGWWAKQTRLQLLAKMPVDVGGVAVPGERSGEGQLNGDDVGEETGEEAETGSMPARSSLWGPDARYVGSRPVPRSITIKADSTAHNGLHLCREL
jgi:hypothetical protein